jgi:hypothetical protein
MVGVPSKSTTNQKLTSTTAQNLNDSPGRSGISLNERRHRLSSAPRAERDCPTSQVAEVGGAFDPDNEAHELVMSVFGGMSKGERTRIKIRVRTAMAAQTRMEGRYLGGRPPYGYTLKDLGPHPNPAKASDGRRLHGLTPDPHTAPIVIRIFTEFLAGNGLFVIAEGLTRDGIPCPSANDPTRNRHRSGIAWAKSAVRVILTNPATLAVRSGTSNVPTRCSSTSMTSLWATPRS